MRKFRRSGSRQSPEHALESRTLTDSLMRWLECTAEQITEGEIYTAPGVRGLISPCLPDSTTYNSVAYSDQESLLASLDEIEARFKDRQIIGWSVLTPPTDGGLGRKLRRRGYRRDGGPEAMFRDLDQLPAPERDLRLVESPTAEAMAEVNARAYGYPPNVFGRLFSGQPRGLFPYLAVVDSRPVTTIQIIEEGPDATVFGMATDPDFQGQGFARDLLLHALGEARERGRRCSTLEATRAGRPVYEGVGYRSLGSMGLWEMHAG